MRPGKQSQIICLIWLVAYIYILFRCNYDCNFLKRTSVPQFSLHQPLTGALKRAFK